MKNPISILYIFMSLTYNLMAQTGKLQTVPEVDLKRYVGLWYEIASFPQKFQKGCKCTTAEYQLTDKDYIKVINRCQKPGKSAGIEGKAFVVPGTGNAKLKVQFFWPFKGDYWIVELDPDYQWAAVGNESRKYLWVLCRSVVLEDTLYNDICHKLLLKGFNIHKLEKTKHDCK
jgi:apolipoprotein D and lipocalin family protein